MAVSNAFDELSAVLARLEANDAEVRAVTVGEAAIESGGDVTAELTVAVPLFAASAIRDGVTIDARNADLEDQQVSLDLTVTVPVTDESPDNAVNGLLDGATSAGRSDATPAYKDPDALATAYAEYDTFPEMTAALDVDVTSETVRRHAIKFGIHDPDDNTPPSGRDLVQHAAEITETQSGDDTGGTDPDDGRVESAADGVGSAVESAESHDEKPEPDMESEPETDRPRTDGSQRLQREGPATESHQSDRPPADRGTVDGDTADAEAAENTGDARMAEQSIAELLSKTTDSEQETTVVTDGWGVSSDLTVGDICTAVNRSRTVHEAKHNLDMSRDNARQLLEELDLIQFVINPLATDQIEIRPAEVVRRIDPEQP